MTQKGIRVIIRKEVGEELHKLNKAAKEEKRNGIKGSEKQKLLASITKAINKLKIDPVAGIQIPMKLMPKRYVALHLKKPRFKTLSANRILLVHR